MVISIPARKQSHRRRDRPANDTQPLPAAQANDADHALDGAPDCCDYHGCGNMRILIFGHDV